MHVPNLLLVVVTVAQLVSCSSHERRFAQDHHRRSASSITNSYTTTTVTASSICSNATMSHRIGTAMSANAYANTKDGGTTTTISSLVNTASSAPSTNTLASSTTNSALATKTSSCNAICSNYDPTPYNASTPIYYGFNVVNSKPVAIGITPYKTPQDWDTALSTIRQYFPNTTAIRIYSTTDVQISDGMITTHLMNAIPAAKTHKFKIVVGVWSGGSYTQARFYQEAWALEQAVIEHGCESLAAVSVGNEDLNDWNKPEIKKNLPLEKVLERKIDTTNVLIEQIGQVRKMLREHGCCDVPVTHTDTSNELTNIENPELENLIKAVDHAIITNIFPYWAPGGLSVPSAWEVFANQTSSAYQIAKSHNRDLWLGETGWALRDDQHHNPQGTNIRKAQSYFHELGCQVLSGMGSAFYYVDWDQDAPSLGRPSFGVFGSDGSPLFDLDCEGSKVESRVADYELPAFAGGNTMGSA